MVGSAAPGAFRSAPLCLCGEISRTRRCWWGPPQSAGLSRRRWRAHDAGQSRGGRMESAGQVGDLAGIGPRLAGLAERVAGDAALLRRGRYLNTTCQLIIGEGSVLL